MHPDPTQSMLSLRFVIRVLGHWSALWRLEPLQVPKSPAHLLILDLSPSQLLLLWRLCLERHVAISTSIRGCGAVDWCGSTPQGIGRGEKLRCRNGEVLDKPEVIHERLHEFFVMGNHDNTALEALDSMTQTTERISVQEIGRLIEDQDVWFNPHGCRNDNLDLLSTGKTANLVMLSDIRIQADILKVLANDVGLELTETKTLSSGFLVVKLLNQLRKALLQKGLAGDSSVPARKEVLPLNLVLKTLLRLLTTDDALNLTLSFSVAHLKHGLHLNQVLVCEDTGGLHVGLSIVTILVTPDEILQWGLLEMHLNVLQGVLSDISNTEIRMFLNSSRLRNKFAHQDTNERTLSCTVGALDSDAR